jgi:hypothetical protein
VKHRSQLDGGGMNAFLSERGSERVPYLEALWHQRQERSENLPMEVARVRLLTNLREGTRLV